MTNNSLHFYKSSKNLKQVEGENFQILSVW